MRVIRAVLKSLSLLFFNEKVKNETKEKKSKKKAQKEPKVQNAAGKQ